MRPIKPRIWYSNRYDCWFVGISRHEPTSRYPTLREMTEDWRNAMDWFDKRAAAAGLKMIVQLY